MKNRTLIVAALVMVLLCVGLIFLGLRHENAGGGSPGQSQTADGDTQSQAQQDITATLAVCGDIMSHLPQTNDAYDAAPTPTATSPASSTRKPGRRAQTIPSATWRPR